MAKKDEVLPQEPQVPEVNDETNAETIETENNDVSAPTFDKIIKKLIEKCGKPKKVVVKNTNYEDMDTYRRVSFTLRQELPAFVADGDDFVEGKHNVIFSSAYALAGMLKESDELAWLGNIILAKPDAMNLLFSAATLSVIQQRVAANEEYVNPFSREGEATSKEHDWIVNHIVGIELSKVGMKVYDRLMDKILDM